MNDRTELATVSDPPAVRALRDNLMAQRTRFENLLPSIMKPEELFSIAVSAVQKTPKLLECSQESLIKSLTDAARLGLRPDGLLSEGWLVPRWSKQTRSYEAQFQTGYRGLEMLMRRAGAQKVVTRLVYEEEEFRIVYGREETIEHTPRFDIERADENIKLVYAWQLDANGVFTFEVMTRAECLKIRDHHAPRDRDGKLTGPWITDEPEMLRKTCLRRLAKHSELSTEAKEVLGHEDGDTPITVTVEPVKPAEPRRVGTKRLREKLEMRKEPEASGKEARPEQEEEPAAGEADRRGEEERPADQPAQEDQPTVATGAGAADPKTGEVIDGADAADGPPVDVARVLEITGGELVEITGGEPIEEEPPATEAAEAPEGDPPSEGEVEPGIYIGRVAFPAAGEKYDGLLKSYPDGKRRTYFGLTWAGGELLIVAVGEVADRLFTNGKFTLREKQRVKIAGKAYKPTTGAFKGRQLVAVDALEVLEA